MKHSFRYLKNFKLFEYQMKLFEYQMKLFEYQMNMFKNMGGSPKDSTNVFINTFKAKRYNVVKKHI